MDKILSVSIQEKNTEINYAKGENLQGKIYCPLLNCKISDHVCTDLMDKQGWPRNIEPHICNWHMNCNKNKMIQRGR